MQHTIIMVLHEMAVQQPAVLRRMSRRQAKPRHTMVKLTDEQKEAIWTVICITATVIWTAIRVTLVFVMAAFIGGLRAIAKSKPTD